MLVHTYLKYLYLRSNLNFKSLFQTTFILNCPYPYFKYIYFKLVLSISYSIFLLQYLEYSNLENADYYRS